MEWLIYVVIMVYPLETVVSLYVKMCSGELFTVLDLAQS